MVRFKRANARGEKWAFFIALLAGGGAIIALRLWGLGASRDAAIVSIHWTAWAAIAVAIATIVVYAFYAWRIPQSDVSIDQAADNAYYLGLVFTLLSLVFALLQVQNLLDVRATDPDSAGRPLLVLDLLPDFGLALVSTIAGIIARVVLQQFRSGFEEAEERARIELSNATAEFRDKLYVAVGDFTNATRAATNAMSDITAHTQTTLKVAADSTADTVREAGKQISQASAEFSTGAVAAIQRMQEFAGQSGEASRKLQAQIEAVVESWREQHAAALEALGQQGAESLKQLVACGGELLAQVRAQSEAATEQLRKQTERADADSVRIGESLAALGDHAAEAQTKIAQLAETGETFTRTLAELNGAMRNAARRTAEQVTGVEQLLEQTKIAVADSAHIGGNLTALGERAAEAQTKVAQLAEAGETFTHAFAELNRALQDTTKHITEQAAAAPPHKQKRKWQFWRR